MTLIAARSSRLRTCGEIAVLPIENRHCYFVMKMAVKFGVIVNPHRPVPSFFFSIIFNGLRFALRR